MQHLALVLLMVSIPHRQAKNSYFSFYWLFIFWFQFLIGRLKTISICQSYPLTKILFQFLIGRLKTQLVCFFRSYLPKFQFLIGRLKTSFFFPSYNTTQRVSIPHRQAKNVTQYVRKLLQKQVSIPHRQAKNNKNIIHIDVLFLVSIPHRQAKNTNCFCNKLSTLCFNSSQVG